MIRWQQFYLEKDECITIPPSKTAKMAGELFVQNNKQLVLDVGCGIGRDANYLSQLGFTVVGMDLAGSGLAIANRLREENGLLTALAQADARRLPFETAVFDAIYCFGILHEFTQEGCEQDVQSVMREIERVLGLDGNYKVWVGAFKKPGK